MSRVDPLDRRSARVEESGCARTLMGKPSTVESSAPEWMAPTAGTRMRAAKGGDRRSALGQRSTHELVNGRRVVALEVVWAGQRRTSWYERPIGQREHLKARAVEGDQVHGDELVAQLEVVLDGQPERRADAIVGVEADAITVAGEDEEEIQRALLMSQRSEEAAVEEPGGQERESSAVAADPPHSVRANRCPREPSHSLVGHWQSRSASAAGLAIATTKRRAVDLDGVALVTKSAEQGADESLVSEEVGPFRVVKICGNNRCALAIPLFHQLEKDIGLLGTEI